MSDDECICYGTTDSGFTGYMPGRMVMSPSSDFRYWSGEASNITIENCLASPPGDWSTWSFDDAKRWLEWDIERNRGGG